MAEKTNPALALGLEEILKQQKAEIAPKVNERTKQALRRVAKDISALAAAVIESSIRFDKRPLEVLDTVLSQLDKIAEETENHYLPQVQPEKEPDLNQSLRTYVLAQPQGNRLSFDSVKLYLDAKAKRDVPAQEVGRRLKKLEDEGLLQKDQTHKGRRTIYIIKEPSKTYQIPQQEPTVEETPTGIRYDSAQDQFYFNAAPIKLGVRVKTLISILFQSPNQPLENSSLANRTFERSFDDEQTAKKYLATNVGRARESLKKAGAENPADYLVTIPNIGYALYPQGKPQEPEPSNPTTTQKPQRRFMPGETRRVLEEYSSPIPPGTAQTLQQIYNNLKDSFIGKQPPSRQTIARTLKQIGWETVEEGHQTLYLKPQPAVLQIQQS